MANNTGTLVTAAIRPFSEADRYPTAYANEILGGLKACNTITERNAIPTERLLNGTVVYVAETDRFYKYDGTAFGQGKLLTLNDYPDADKTSVSTINQYITYPLAMTNGKYINFAGTGELDSGIRCYATIINDGTKHFITSTIGGSAMKLLFFYNASNVLLSTQFTGVDTGNTPFTDYEVQFPEGCAYYKVNGFVASGGVILKKRQNMFSYLGNVLSSNIVQTPTFDISGKYPWNNGSIQIDATRKYATYNILPTDILRVSTAVGGSAMWAIVYLDANNQVVGYENKGRDGFVDFVSDYQLTIPLQATKMYLSGLVGYNYSLTKYTVFTKAVSTAQLAVEQERITKLENGSSNLLSGKTFLHFGTSIPEGGRYPTDGPAKYGGVGINMAVGSSTARISRADGTFNALAWQNWAYSLLRKQSEIQTDIFDQWNTAKGTLLNNPPDVLSDAEKTKIMQCSYEYRLIPYLDGTHPMPDFFVFDHGRNDGYSNDLSVIPAQRDDRRYFIGAMNYLIDIILQYNKFAKIIFIGHYENDLLTPVSQAQEVLADYWGFPLLRMWEKTGFSQQKVKGSASLWTQVPWSNYTTVGQDLTLDMNVQRVYLPDGIHPHTEGVDRPASKLLTRIYANFIKDLV